MPTLRLALRGSRALAAVVVVVHAGGAAGILLSVPGWPGMVLAALLLALGAAAAWDRALLRGARAARAVELADGGSFSVLLASGRRLEGRARGRRHVGAWWVLLPVTGWRGAILVGPGMLEAGALRQLRLWALWGKIPLSGTRAVPG